MGSKGKTALVTGSSSGIGFAVANGFLHAGWNVVLNGRNEDKLRNAAERLGHSGQVTTVAGSTSDRSTGEAMVRAANERFGGVDVLVNNAGEFGLKPFLDVTEADLEHYWTVNLKGTYLTTQAVVRSMIARGHSGNIINIGTVLAEHGLSWATASAAIISKGGVRALTIALAAELAPQGIRVNAVSPGFTRTALISGGDPATLAGAALMARIGDVEDVSAAVLYLSDAINVTGHVLHVDGGYVSGRR